MTADWWEVVPRPEWKAAYLHELPLLVARTPQRLQGFITQWDDVWEQQARRTALTERWVANTVALDHYRNMSGQV